MEPFSFEKLPDALQLLLEKMEYLEQLLLNLQPQNEKAKKMMNVQEAAAFLNITVTALYSLVSRRDIPVNKPGKRLYFDEDELTEWIKSGRRKTATEIADNATSKLRSSRRIYHH